MFAVAARKENIHSIINLSNVYIYGLPQLPLTSSVRRSPVVFVVGRPSLVGCDIESPLYVPHLLYVLYLRSYQIENDVWCPADPPLEKRNE